MQTKSSSFQLLLTAAVISLTVLCAAGIATLTGLVPSSLSATRIAEPLFKATAPASTPKPARKRS
jgi:hypothetical protein